MTRLLRYTLLLAVLALVLIGALIFSLTWRPDARETLPVSCTGTPPTLVPGQALKVMTWNVQYLAGKRYVFWNDLAQGNDEAPTLEDMAFSLDEVARVIRDEQPDVVLLQELDDGAKASDYQNQLKLLQERVADLYPCSASAFDWKADFVPDPHIFGSVGRQLATLSRYRIEHAERLQLPVAAANFISRQFQPKDALLATKLPLSDGGQLTVFNTHLERASQPDDTLAGASERRGQSARQVRKPGPAVADRWRFQSVAARPVPPPACRAAHALLRRQRTASAVGQVPDDPDQQRSQRQFAVGRRWRALLGRQAAELRSSSGFEIATDQPWRALTFVLVEHFGHGAHLRLQRVIGLPHAPDGY